MSFSAGSGTADTDWEFYVADIYHLAFGSSMLYSWNGRSADFKSPEPNTKMTAFVIMHQPNCNPKRADVTILLVLFSQALMLAAVTSIIPSLYLKQGRLNLI